jgi:putative PIN family toxin of toxin-antitoxin system
MIVVVDSGVWISGFAYGGTPLATLRQVYKQHQIAVCDRILFEVRSVLAAKFAWNSDRIEDALADYFDNTICFGTTGAIRGVCRDPNDDMVLECAARSHADVIVSGDKDLLAVGEYEGIRILTPRAFLDEVAGTIQS